MKLPRVAFGVPLHPLLVHFPITFWLATPVLDLAALYAGVKPWWTLALSATAAGVIIGVVVIVSGLLEYLEPSVVGIDIRLAARHGIRTTMAWGTFTTKWIVAILTPITAVTITLAFVLDLIGCVLLVQGVFFGTRQVYQQLEK
jgi:uncharacterized membrane protein